MTKIEEEIKKLREEGKSYRQITRELGCPKSLVAYHLNPNVKRKYLDYRKENRTRGVISKKINGFKRGKKRMMKVDSIIKNYNLKDVMSLIGSDPKCYLTGDKINLSDTASWNMDHIIPTSRGGYSELSNLGITTREANWMKSDLLIEELIDLCRKVLENNGYSVIRAGSSVG